MHSPTPPSPPPKQLGMAHPSVGNPDGLMTSLYGIALPPQENASADDHRLTIVAAAANTITQ